VGAIPEEAAGRARGIAALAPMSRT